MPRSKRIVSTLRQSAAATVILAAFLLANCSSGGGVTAPAKAVAITTTSLPGGTVGSAYSQTLTATGGTGTYAWSLVGGNVPAGLTLGSAGVLFGSPTTAGTFGFTVQVASGTQTATQVLSLTAVPTLTITTTTLPASFVGNAYSQTLTAAGGIGGYAWSVASGSLPAGLTLSSGGVLSGTPTTASGGSFTVQVTSGTQTATLPLDFPDPLVIATTSLGSGFAGRAYSATLQASGGYGYHELGGYGWSVVSGSLPAGLTLSSGGVLSGTPTTAGTSNFTVQANATSFGSPTATQTLSIVVNP